MSDEQDGASDSSPAAPTLLTSEARNRLRRTLRQRRNAVTTADQRIAAQKVAHRLRRQVLRPGLRIAVYSAFDGEIDLEPFIRIAKRLHCTLYAPRIVDSKRRRMEFIQLAPQVGQRRNPFGMIEPRDAPARRIHARHLDVVLTAVIAFDVRGWRLGFGGGYYDRKLAFKRRGVRTPPLFVGVAHAFQRVAPVQPAPWDVLLDAIVTPDGVHRCPRLAS